MLTNEQMGQLAALEVRKAELSNATAAEAQDEAVHNEVLEAAHLGVMFAEENISVDEVPADEPAPAADLFVEHELKATDILTEPLGYQSYYDAAGIGRNCFVNKHDVNWEALMPDIPRLGWLTAAYNWGNIYTEENPVALKDNQDASSWFGASLARTGGFFVLTPSDTLNEWNDVVVVPTPFGLAEAKRCLHIKCTNTDKKDELVDIHQYVFLRNVDAKSNSVHNYMLKHVARMVSLCSTHVKSSFDESQIVEFLKEGLNDPAIRWYANQPSFFYVLMMDHRDNLIPADNSYNARAWSEKVTDSKYVREAAIDHYTLTLAAELRDTETHSDALVARAMLLNLRQRIMQHAQVRSKVRSKNDHTVSRRK